MDFTVEGKSFRAMGIAAVVLGTEPAAVAQAAVVSVDDAAGTVLRLPRGAKGWQAVALRLEHGTEVQLPLPQEFAVRHGDALVLGCLGPIAAAQGGTLSENAPLEVYAVQRATKAPQRRAASRQSRISRGVRRILTSIGKPPGCCDKRRRKGGVPRVVKRDATWPACA